jgi:hypothetical protein
LVLIGPAERMLEAVGVLSLSGDRLVGSYPTFQPEHFNPR